jgi:hypothetical protein
MCEDFKVKYLCGLPMDILMNECCDTGKCYIKENPTGDSSIEILKIVEGKLRDYLKLEIKKGCKL